MPGLGMSTIELHIEELTLHGVPPADREHVARELSDQIASSLRETPAANWSARASRRLDSLTIKAEPGGLRTLGARVGRAVSAELVRAPRGVAPASTNAANVLSISRAPVHVARQPARPNQIPATQPLAAITVLPKTDEDRALEYKAARLRNEMLTRTLNELTDLQRAIELIGSNWDARSSQLLYQAFGPTLMSMRRLLDIAPGQTDASGADTFSAALTQMKRALAANLRGTFQIAKVTNGSDACAAATTQGFARPPASINMCERTYGALPVEFATVLIHEGFHNVGLVHGSQVPGNEPMCDLSVTPAERINNPYCMTSLVEAIGGRTSVQSAPYNTRVAPNVSP
jgi:hypothetical protein